jgi:adenylosuccinate synthase
VLSECVPIYKEFPGWNSDITDVNSYEFLPENARLYVEKLDELIGVPIKYVSVGPAREQTFKK